MRLIQVIERYSNAPIESVEVKLACRHVRRRATDEMGVGTPVDIEVGDIVECNECHILQKVVMVNFKHQPVERSQ